MDSPDVDKTDSSTMSQRIHEPEVMLSEDNHSASARPDLTVSVNPEDTEPSDQITPAARTVPAKASSSRPQRGAAAVAASTIAHLAQSEAFSLPSPSSPQPPPTPAAVETVPVVAAAAAAPPCEVCAAAVSEAVPEDAAARRAAAALLGADSAPCWLCRSCADLLRLIDRRRRQLDAARRLFWERHRHGAARKQAMNSNIKSNNLKLEFFDAEAADDADLVEDDSNINCLENEDKETNQEDEKTVRASDSESAAAAVTLTTRRSRSAVKQCGTCGKQFRTWRALDGHVNSHTGARPYMCAHCDRRFSSRPALRQHQGIHTNKWVCDICQKVYSTEPALSTHRSYVHYPERLKTITCPVCGKEFLGQKRYNKHSLTHTTDAERFLCPEEGCDSSFKTRNALNVHACKHQGKRFACDQCPALFFSKASMQQHMVRHGAVEARFACPHCPRRFIYNSILRCHMASAHNSERDRVCEVCGATFTCNSALNAHKLSHQEDRPFVCVVCGAGFKRKQILARHVRFVHNREVTVRCDQCDKGFQTPHKLKIHMRSHTGERPFSCPLCQKRFSQQSHVRSHMQMHVEFAAAAAAVPVVPVPVQVVDTVAPSVPVGAAVALPVHVMATEAPPALEVSEVAALLPVVPGGPEMAPPREEMVTPLAAEQ